MEVHFDEGTQRLELPVSRTTLNSCGGVPSVTVAKSKKEISIQDGEEGGTLSVEEICQWKTVACLIGYSIDGDLRISII